MLFSSEEAKTFVPSDMKTVSLVSFFKISLMTAEIIIPSTEFSNLSNGMKRLMDVANVVNEKAEGQRSCCMEVIVCELHHIGVNEARLEISDGLQIKFTLSQGVWVFQPVIEVIES